MFGKEGMKLLRMVWGCALKMCELLRYVEIVEDEIGDEEDGWVSVCGEM